jgi:hypothetical protein
LIADEEAAPVFYLRFVHAGLLWLMGQQPLESQRKSEEPPLAKAAYAALGWGLLMGGRLGVKLSAEKGLDEGYKGYLTSVS